MTVNNGMRPVHPGEILRDELQALGLSANALSKALDRAMKRSSLGLDLYFWLVYRTFTLKAPLTLSWRQLYRQFGANPSAGTSTNGFRASCLRELKKIKRAWPDLGYRTVTGGLVIEPSPPRIPPSQLRFISE